jgi:hypothetical protein
MSIDSEAKTVTLLGIEHPIANLIEKNIVLKDWEIWHSYSSYFLEEIEDLYTLADKLVKNQFCVIAYHSDGTTWCDYGNEIRRYNLTNPSSTKQFAIETQILPNINYIKECSFQASMTRNSEIKLLGPGYIDTFSYILLYLSPICVTEQGHHIFLYPQIKLFTNGVIIISFREKHSKTTYEIDCLIKNDVNLALHHQDALEIPLGLARIHLRCSVLKNGARILKRLKVLNKANDLNKYIDTHKRSYTDNGITFEVFPLKRKDITSVLSLQSLKDIIITSLSFIVNNKKEEFDYLLSGNIKPSRIITGNYWLGYPSIYLLNFENQPETSVEIIEKYSDDLLKIMNRATTLSPLFGGIEKNLRLSDDYCVFMNIALILWVSSKKDYNKMNTHFNREAIICEREVLVQSVNYLIMTHERQYERASNDAIHYKSLLKEQLSIINLDKLSNKLGHYGEIMNFHKYAFQVFELSEIQKQAIDCLKIRSDYEREEKNESLLKLGLMISIIFGILQAPSFADYVIGPLFVQLGIQLPIGLESQKLILFAVTVVIIIVFTLMLWRLIPRIISHRD